MLPSLEALERRLSAALSQGATTVRVLARTPNDFESTSPTEIVTCEVGIQPAVRFFCKHFTPLTERAFGKDGAAFYEIDVYRKVLTPAPVDSTRVFGTWISPDTNEGLLVLEFLEENRRLGDSRKSNDTAEAAAIWLGEFHRYAAELIGQPQAAFLRRRDSSFYDNHWRRLAANVLGHAHSPSWLAAFATRFDVVLGMLDAAPLTIIHGEFYPQNILRHGDRVLPVDWETAAIGLGETDIVTLVDGWHRVRDRCISAYSAARGLSDSSDDQMQRIALAQILISVYWLSYSDHSADDPRKVARIDRHLNLMHQAAGQLGLL
jgi:hypothetical protein